MHSIFRVSAMLLTGLALTGCQVLWASITSPSDWVSGSSTSLSGSSEGFLVSSGSGGGESSFAYLEDVRVLTANLAADPGDDPDAFLREIGRVAASHGVADWEQEAATYHAIGAGLFDAGVAETEVGARLERLGAGAAGDERRERVLEGFRTAAL